MHILWMLILVFYLFCILLGIPRQKRGEIWLFLAKKYCSYRKCAPVDDTPYGELLRKLTPYQHAILVDIGELLKFTMH